MLKFSGQARLHRCLSPEVLVASLQFRRGGRGPRACNWGRAKGHSLSFLCPLESQRAGGARAGVGAGRLSMDLRAKVFGDEGLNASLCSLTLAPFLKGLLYPLPGPLPPWGSRPLTSCSHTPHPSPRRRPPCPIGHPRAFALIWLSQLQAGPPLLDEPQQPCLSHFVFLRFGSGALAGFASKALSG